MGAQLVSLELSYSSPGARSMGFGGAFAAQADDATGLGLALERLQVDVGVDLSESRNTASISGIFSF